MVLQGRLFQNLVKITLAAVLLISSAACAFTQSIRNIPVHFHVHPNAQVKIAQLDEQINEINRVYAKDGVPFRFQRQSVDSIPNRIGNQHDLNVQIIPEFDSVGHSAFPQDYADDPEGDQIILDDDALPNSPWRSSGIVLIHEIGHWLGLRHTTNRTITAPNCLNQPPLISVKSKTCELTSGQIDQMVKSYDQYRQ